MKTKFFILICLIFVNRSFCYAHKVKIGRFEIVQNEYRMSVYACGENFEYWDYIYIDSPWLEPIFIERKNLNNFLNYTIKAAEIYKQWTSEVEKNGNVSNFHKHIGASTDVMVLEYSGNYTKSIDIMYEKARPIKLSYDFFVNAVGETRLECNVVMIPYNQPPYNRISFYLDSVGVDDFIYVLEHATERYIKNPNVKTDKLLDFLSK